MAKRLGETLFRAVESAFPAIPKTVRNAYPRDELVNATWLILHSRGVRRPTKLQVRNASIDFHRSNTRYRKGNKHGDVLTGDVHVPEQPVNGNGADHDDHIEIHLRDIRRRFGTDGLAVFLLSRVMDLAPRAVSVIMDYEPNSALARSLGALGGKER